MKIFSTYLFYLLCIASWAFLQSGALSAQVLNWSYENIITDIQQSGANPDLVQDANGNLHVSYWQADEDRLMYGRRNATTGEWAHETLDIGDNFHGYNSAIALDAAGFVHIAYVKRIQSHAQIRYITNKSGSWQVEIPYPDDHIGKYGKDLEYPVYAQASLDIFFQADGNPVILYFDAKFTTLGNCGSIINQTYLDYDLDMNMVVRLNDGSWEFGPFENIPDKKGYGCLLDGDRFGEFCQMLTTSDNRYFALGNSLHNHDLLLFTSPDLINWNYISIDSTSRFFNTVNENHFREGFEFIDANLLGDSSIHMVYGVSNHYGNGDIFNVRNPLFYTQFYPDSIGMPGYQAVHKQIGGSSGIYRSFSSIANLSEDSIYVSFFDLNNSQLMLGSSHNGGLNWQYEIVDQIQTNTSLHILANRDSLRILAYDSEKNHMLLYSKAKLGTEWRIEKATKSELRGNLMSSHVTRSNGTDLKQVVYKEEIEGKVYFGSSDGGTWSFEEVLPDADKVEALALDIDANNSPVFIYTDDAIEQVRIAWRQNGWNTRFIAGNAKARNLKFLLANGQYHVAYFDLNTGHLHYLNSAALTGPWTLSVVDSSSNIVGRGLDMAQESDGTLHLSYYDVINPQVRHATLAQGSTWQVENITPVSNFNPNSTSIAIDSDDFPYISFHDATSNKIFLQENDGLGWSQAEVTGEGGNLIGTPMDLLLDDKNRPWILYNISDIRDEIGLVRRDEFGVWNQVSVNNNNAEIARSFDFHLVEEDFYILGKKNQLSNNGLGLLFAHRGVKTDIPDLLSQTSLNIFPNPAQKSLEVSFDNPIPQEVSLELYNLNGQRIHLVQETSLFPAGSHKILVDLPETNPGVYILLWKSETYQIPKKLILVP